MRRTVPTLPVAARSALALTLTTTGLLAVGTSAHAASSPTTTCSARCTVTFTYTGGPQIWQVPEGVLNADVDLIGASGDDADQNGGDGQEVQSSLDLRGIPNLQINVGGEGQDNHIAAFNGGGAGLTGGGGATDIRSGAADGYSLGDRLLVAGGGGGVGGVGTDAGPAGLGGKAGSAGGNGSPSSACGASLGAAGGGGAGGTDAAGAGGAGSTNSAGAAGQNGGAGALGSGGAGGSSGGGGGGGGWFGGGAGGGPAGVTDGSCRTSSTGAGGGGGSSYAGVDGTITPAGNSARVVITYDASTLAPVVSGCTPSSGTARGGTLTTIHGQHLAETTSVRFGSGQVYGTIVGSPTDTAVQVRTPAYPNSTGFADVTVTTPAGTASGPGFDFLVGDPSPIDVSGPGAAPVGATVTLTGSAFPGDPVDIWFAQRDQGFSLRRVLVTASDGSFETTFVATADESFYAKDPTDSNATSAVRTFTVTPGLAGPAAQVVRRGTTVVLRGTASAGSTVTLRFHRAADRAGSYPIVRTVGVDATGHWSRPLVATTDYRFFARTTSGLLTASHLVQVR